MLAKIVCFAVIALYVVVDSQTDDKGNANQFVDQLLGVVKDKMNATLDPFKVPDIHLVFDKKIAASTWHGDINMTEGLIKGLNGLKRSGDCDVSTPEGHFQANIQIGDANVHAHFHVVSKIGIIHLAPIHSTMNWEVDIGAIDIKATIGVGDDSKPELKTLELDELKNVHLKITGLNIFTPLANFIANEFVKDFNPKVRELLGGMLKDVVAKEIKNLSFPGAFYSEQLID